VRDTGSTDHRVPLFKVDPFEKTASPRQGGSMDDLVREIKQMTIKKPDPYVGPPPRYSYQIPESQDVS
jgi:hypothetical protein